MVKEVNSTLQILMSPVYLVFPNIVTVKLISKMHLKQTHPFYLIIQQIKQQNKDLTLALFSNFLWEQAWSGETT